MRLIETLILIASKRSILFLIIRAYLLRYNNLWLVKVIWNELISLLVALYDGCNKRG